MGCLQKTKREKVAKAQNMNFKSHIRIVGWLQNAKSEKVAKAQNMNFLKVIYVLWVAYKKLKVKKLLEPKI